MMCSCFGNARDADNKVKAFHKEVKPEIEKIRSYL